MNEPKKIFDGLIRFNHLRPPLITLYGPEGVGKTSMMAQAKAPLFIPVEMGLGSLNVAATPTPKTYEQFIELLEMAATGDHEFKTLIVDSLDKVEILINEFIAAEAGVSDVSDISFFRGYKKGAKYWNEIIYLTNKIIDAGITVVFIAHSAITKIEDPIHGDFDKWSIKLYKDSAAIVRESSDIIIFCQYDMVTKKEDKGFGVKKNRAIASGDRSMHLIGSPTFDAKNRYGLPASLPLDWSEFQAAFTKAIKSKREEK